MTNSDLLSTFAFALGAAFLGAALAARLGQSVILGYLLAGLAIGPFTPGPVGDRDAVAALADIGIVLLMFAIGVQFSFRELVQAGRIAIAGGLVQVILTMGLGYLAAVSLGWSHLEALFFGAFVSNSSSTVLTKVLGERGEIDTPYGKISLAWSTVQDLSTVALVVLLSALATGDGAVGEQLLLALAKAGLFLLLAVSVGSQLLPWLFDKVTALRSREIFILAVAFFALGTAYVSSLFGLSLALGAFIAGMVVSESDLAHHILGEVTPLRDIFSGLFFVSIGMLIDPGFILTNILLVVLALVLIIPVKGLLTATIAALAGAAPRTALLIGVTLAQSAEFSFVLARLGVELGVVTPQVFSLMLTGAVASVMLAPLLHRIAPSPVAWLERRIASRADAGLPYSNGATAQLLRDHAVVCGYGRVGQLVTSVLLRSGIPTLVIEQDQRLVRALRERGVPALVGNAANPSLLERANLAQARMLIIALADPLAVRQVADYARAISPDLHIIVRTHSDAEAGYLQNIGVGHIVMGERELAREIARRALHHFGLSTTETETALDAASAAANGQRTRTTA